VAAKANNLTWTQAYEQRQRETRIAASLQRAEARIAAQVNASMKPLQGNRVKEYVTNG